MTWCSTLDTRSAIMHSLCIRGYNVVCFFISSVLHCLKAGHNLIISQSNYFYLQVLDRTHYVMYCRRCAVRPYLHQVHLCINDLYCHIIWVLHKQDKIWRLHFFHIEESYQLCAFNNIFVGYNIVTVRIELTTFASVLFARLCKVVIKRRRAQLTKIICMWILLLWYIVCFDDALRSIQKCRIKSMHSFAVYVETHLFRVACSHGSIIK